MRRFTVFVVSLFMFVLLSYADSLAELRTQTRRYLKDNGATLQRHSDDSLNDLINEGQKDAVNRTWAIEDVETITLVGQTTYYSLASDMIAIRQVYFVNSSGSNTTLEEVMERSLRQSNPDFEADIGSPTEYFVRQSTSGANPLEIGIRPIPASVTTETVQYYFFTQATALSSDSDIPFDGVSHLIPYHHILSYYAAARIYLLEGNLNRATGFNTLYESGVNIMRDRIGQSPNFNQSFKTNIGR